MRRTSVVCIRCGVRWEQHREDICEAGSLLRGYAGKTVDFSGDEQPVGYLVVDYGDGGDDEDGL